MEPYCIKEKRMDVESKHTCTCQKDDSLEESKKDKADKPENVFDGRKSPEIEKELKEFQDLIRERQQNNQCGNIHDGWPVEMNVDIPLARKWIPPISGQEEDMMCIFSKVGCDFQTSTEIQMKAHMEESLTDHVEMVLNTTLNLAKWRSSELRKQTRVYQTLLEYCHKHVQLEQRNRILELKVEALQRRIEEKSMLSDLEFTPSLCAYFWRVRNFSQKVTDSILQSGSNVYSQNFYTGTDGYCVCLRLSLTPSLNLSDVGVGLFVHFVQGKFDDYLVWPFRGTITLSIIDQNETAKRRVSIVERAEASADLQAFQRATGSEKNPNGFGYKQFVTTCILQTGTYLRDDTLIVKCEVKSH